MNKQVWPEIIQLLSNCLDGFDKNALKKKIREFKN